MEGTTRATLEDVRGFLWTALGYAQESAVNGRWSMWCDAIVDQIRAVEALVGPEDRGEVPPSCAAVWDRLRRGEPPHEDGGEALDARREAQARALGIPEGEWYEIDPDGNVRPARLTPR